MQDKRSLVNSEKKLKAIKMELESIEHMQMTQAKPAIDGGVDRTSNVGATNCNTSLASSSSSVSTPSPNAAAVVVVNEADPHAAMSSILEQYIDPNILRILHKVDSQFSISNAINLSSTMKRWLHSCHSIITSVDIRVAGEANNVEVPCDKGIVSHVLKSGTPCNIAHAYDDPRFYSPQDNSTGITTKDVMCVPIFDHKNEAIAVLRAIYHPKGLTIPDPLTHAKYNGAIDLTNAGHGLYIVPILSLWGKPLGVLQVGRTVVPLAKGGPKVEMLEKQAANDALKLHLIALFAQSVRWRVAVHRGEVHNVDEEGTGEYVADPSLPPGWVAIAHGDHVYYENPLSGEQTWIKPTC
ncbi:hypothetical protein DYB38_006313 [Aphanomyces astaci]|uniref:WW domain-containing protein n=2 Tax=Aphanomyces astaci TaxID=112090 RepID=A0A397C4F0_APHAT|nr:hypothetical protein DYB38_006313 [Aphanomyces astaci]